MGQSESRNPLGSLPAGRTAALIAALAVLCLLSIGTATATVTQNATHLTITLGGTGATHAGGYRWILGNGTGYGIQYAARDNNADGDWNDAGEQVMDSTTGSFWQISGLYEQSRNKTYDDGTPDPTNRLQLIAKDNAFALNFTTGSGGGGQDHENYLTGIWIMGNRSAAVNDGLNISLWLVNASGHLETLVASWNRCATWGAGMAWQFVTLGKSLADTTLYALTFSLTDTTKGSEANSFMFSMDTVAPTCRSKNTTEWPDIALAGYNASDGDVMVMPVLGNSQAWRTSYGIDSTATWFVANELDGQIAFAQSRVWFSNATSGTLYNLSGATEPTLQINWTFTANGWCTMAIAQETTRMFEDYGGSLEEIYFVMPLQPTYTRLTIVNSTGSALLNNSADGVPDATHTGVPLLYMNSTSGGKAISIWGTTQTGVNLFWVTDLANTTNANLTSTAPFATALDNGTFYELELGIADRTDSPLDTMVTNNLTVIGNITFVMTAPNTPYASHEAYRAYAKPLDSNVNATWTGLTFPGWLESMGLYVTAISGTNTTFAIRANNTVSASTYPATIIVATVNASVLWYNVSATGTGGTLTGMVNSTIHGDAWGNSIFTGYREAAIAAFSDTASVCIAWGGLNANATVTFRPVITHDCADPINVTFTAMNEDTSGCDYTFAVNATTNTTNVTIAWGSWVTGPRVYWIYGNISGSESMSYTSANQTLHITTTGPTGYARQIGVTGLTPGQAYSVSRNGVQMAGVTITPDANGRARLATTCTSTVYLDLYPQGGAGSGAGSSISGGGSAVSPEEAEEAEEAEKAAEAAKGPISLTTKQTAILAGVVVFLVAVSGYALSIAGYSPLDKRTWGFGPRPRRHRRSGTRRKSGRRHS